MGFAKYAEDNFEIMEERRYWTQTRETAPTVLATSSAPLITQTKEATERSTKNKQKKKTRRLVCCECRTSFLFTGGEQHYYEAHNLSKPKRCPSCRRARKRLYSTHKEEQA